MKEYSCVNLFSEKMFSLATCNMIFQFGHEKFRLGPAHLGGFSTGMTGVARQSTGVVSRRFFGKNFLLLERQEMCLRRQIKNL